MNKSTAENNQAESNSTTVDSQDKTNEPEKSEDQLIEEANATNSDINVLKSKEIFNDSRVNSDLKNRVLTTQLGYQETYDNYVQGSPVESGQWQSDINKMQASIYDLVKNIQSFDPSVTYQSLGIKEITKRPDDGQKFSNETEGGSFNRVVTGQPTA
ncbi:hypothetical protein [Mycoplasma nasistruthionis]|uniref:Uncharacterized protein n=1 Tax=Mycoplasma nasistruthionis TaxID=353852 RepID=A0A5B7XVL6_9MOLU|nr:hypothetical protein [Mycoplasma nasistruthionis]QCZ36485.1 hypothetical protein FG904_00380 [Mycoplasma nasistruthionis]